MRASLYNIHTHTHTHTHLLGLCASWLLGYAKYTIVLVTIGRNVHCVQCVCVNKFFVGVQYRHCVHVWVCIMCMQHVLPHLCNY